MSRGPGMGDAAVLRTQLAGVLVRPGRLVMTGLAVVVAAFVVFGTVMAQQITERTALDRFSGTPAATSLIVTAEGGDDSAVTDAKIKAVRAVPGVAEVAARTEIGVSLAGVSPHYLALQGDPGTGRLSRVQVVAGSYPDGPREMAVNRQASEHFEIEPGDRVGILVPEGEEGGTKTVTVTVTAVVRANSDRWATGYAPAAIINSLGDMKGYPQLDIRAEPGVSAEALSERLSPVLRRAGGAAVEITPGTPCGPWRPRTRSSSTRKSSSSSRCSWRLPWSPPPSSRRRRSASSSRSGWANWRSCAPSGPNAASS